MIALIDCWEVHVLPHNDRKAHVGSFDCWCEPYEEDHPDGEKTFIVHNALDKREAFETQ